MKAPDDRIFGSHQLLAEYRSGRRDFTGAEIEDAAATAPLQGATLDDANFSGCFILADFRGCSLRAARFVRANVKTWCFDGADLSGADFTDACIDAATFTGAKVQHASFARSSCYGHTFAADEVPEH